MRLLILQANPTKQSVLQLSREVREIKRSLSNVVAWEIEIVQEGAVQANDLQEILLRVKPDIVHFSGHGTPRGNLIFEDYDGDPEPISTTRLSGILFRFKDYISCVVLNACYSSKQAYAFAKSIPYVIGMTSGIQDSDAIAFSSSFYQALAYGKTIEQAFSLAQEQVKLVSRGRSKTPHVHCKKSPRKKRSSGVLQPEIHAKFDLNRKGKPKRNKNYEYALTVFVHRFPRAAYSCVYQYLDDWKGSIKKKHQFDVIPNDRRGFESEASLYGNVLLRASLWSTEGGIALQSYLSDALRRHYGQSMRRSILDALRTIETY